MNASVPYVASGERVSKRRAGILQVLRAVDGPCSARDVYARAPVVPYGEHTLVAELLADLVAEGVVRRVAAPANDVGALYAYELIEPPVPAISPDGYACLGRLDANGGSMKSPSPYHWLVADDLVESEPFRTPHFDGYTIRITTLGRRALEAYRAARQPERNAL